MEDLPWPRVPPPHAHRLTRGDGSADVGGRRVLSADDIVSSGVDGVEGVATLVLGVLYRVSILVVLVDGLRTHPAWCGIGIRLSIEEVGIPPSVVDGWVRSPNLIHVRVSEDGGREREDKKRGASGKSHCCRRSLGLVW